MKKILVGLIVIFPLTVRAADKPIAPASVDLKEPAAYEKHVEPILRAKCVACHTGKELKGKFDVSSYASLMKGSVNGPVIVPNKPADSRLFTYVCKIKKPFMPPKDEEPLTPQELGILKLWIDQGAKPPTTTFTVQPKIVLTSIPASVHPVRAVAVSADKSTVAAGRANQIHIYDAGSGTFIRT